jgi:hypothetical protein
MAADRDIDVKLRLTADGKVLVNVVGESEKAVEGLGETAEQAGAKGAAGIDKTTRSAVSLKAQLSEARFAVVNIDSAIKGLAAGALAAGGSLLVMASQQARAADEIARNADLANTSTTEFQRWAAASRTVGFEQDKLADVLKDVQDRVGDFVNTGGGPMADFFERIGPAVGVTIEQFRELSGPQALQLYVQSLEKANLPQSEMLFFLEALAGDASRLLPLLRNGGAELRRYGDEAQRLGSIMSEDVITQSRQLLEVQREIEWQFQAFRQGLVSDLIPSIRELADEINSPAFREGFGEIVKGAADAAITVAKLVAELGNLVRFASEELAARTLGPAFDDPLRIEDAIAHQRALISEIERNARPELAFSRFAQAKDVVGLDAARAELARLEAMLVAATEAKAEFDAQMASQAGARAQDAAVDGTPALVDGLDRLGLAAGRTLRPMQRTAESAEALAKAQQAHARVMIEQRAALGEITPAMAAYQLAVMDAAEAQREQIKLGLDAAAAQLQYANAIEIAQRALQDAAVAVSVSYSEEEDAWQSLRGSIDDAIGAEEEQIALLRTSGRAREDLVDQLEAEAAIRQVTNGLTAEEVAGLDDVLQRLRQVIAERQQLQRIASARDGVFNGVSFLLDGALNEVRGGANVWEAFRTAGTSAIGSIASEFGKLVQSTGSFEDALGKLTADGGKIEELGLQLANVVGVAAGGGGTGANVGSAIGGAIGSIWGPIGTAIGSVLGGLVGGLFDSDSPTRISVAGSGGRIGRDEAAGEGSLGRIRVDTRGDQQPASAEVLQAVQQFDRAIASFLTDEQLEAVEARLARFSATGETLEEVLGLRFEAVLEEFTENISSFVLDFSEDLETRVQALSDVLTLQRLAGDADLVTESLDSALTLITEFGRAGERVAETYQRIAQAAIAMDTALVLMGRTLDGTREEIVRQAAELGEAAGSPQRLQGLFDTVWEEFYTEAERAQARVTQARAAAVSEFGDVGLNLDDYLGAGGRDRFRSEFEAAFASGTAEQRLQYLEAAAALAQLNDAQGAYNDLLSEQGVVVDDLVQLNQQALESYAQTAEGVRNALADISARSDFQRQMNQIARDLRSTIDAHQRAAREAGLQAAAETDLARAHQLAAAQVAQAIDALTQSGREQAAELYGSRLGDIDAEIARIMAEAWNPLRLFGSAITEVAQAANAATNLLLGDLSPLRDIEKLPLALQALERGEISADEVLRIAQNVKGSGADYNAIFDQVQAIVARAANAGVGNVGGGGGGDTGGIDPRIAALQREREQLLQQEAGLARFGQANNLAQLIADLIGAEAARGNEISLEDAFRRFAEDRSSLAEFAADLRLDSVDALDAYIDSLQADSYDIATLAQQLRDVFEDHITALRQIYNNEQFPGAIALDVEPGTSGKPIAPVGVLPGINVESTSGNSPAAQQQASLDAAVEEMRAVRTLLERIVESVPATEATAEAARDTAEAVGALTAAIRDAGQPESGPRNLRATTGGRDQYGRQR